MSAEGDQVLGDPSALRAEVARLRGENARLSRLLDLRPGQTDPAPEQPALPTAPPGLVTMRSSIDHKVALYRRLFRSREDVYAYFWERRWKGEKGWSPQYTDCWYPGIDKARRPRALLTRAVLERHLGREDDLFIGLYPLLSDNTCHWLAADFDGDAAMLDALAYVKAARAAGAPTAVEVSRSGTGAHVWIFFSDAVRADLARTMGTGIMHEAITLRGSVQPRSRHNDRKYSTLRARSASALSARSAASTHSHGPAPKDGDAVLVHVEQLEVWGGDAGHAMRSS